jgi:hypothetical protein
LKAEHDTTLARRQRRALLAMAEALVLVGCVMLAAVRSAGAQAGFGWFGYPQQQQQQYQRRPTWQWNQPWTPWGQQWGGGSQYERRRERERPRERERDVDYSQAPPPHKQDGSPTKHVLVIGDSMADWLAYGLEDAFDDTPEIGIVRKHKANSGLIHGEGRNSYDWPSAAKEILASDKPHFIVVMIGLSDRQSIRERLVKAAATKPAGEGVGRPANDAATKPAQNAAKQLDASAKPASNDVAAKPTGTGERGADSVQGPATDEEAQPGPGEPSTAQTPDTVRGQMATYEFRSEPWATAYSRRIDDLIAVLKAKRVPVFWVGLPALRGTRSSDDVAYLNELFRARAEKAGIVYVDVWDGFVDESGSFSMEGPDFEGQTRRLRSPDGVYFTKAGALKLAHYVEHEIRRAMLNGVSPVATPAPEQPESADHASGAGGLAVRPVAGPVVPLTLLPSAKEGLLGGGSPKVSNADATAGKVLVKGEPPPPAAGRVDDFAWPRGEAPVAPESALQEEPSAMAPAETPAAADPHSVQPDGAPSQAAPATRPKPTRSSENTRRRSIRHAAPAWPAGSPFFSSSSWFGFQRPPSAIPGR